MSWMLLTASLVAIHGCSGSSNPPPTTTTNPGSSPAAAASGVTGSPDKVQQAIQEVTTIIANAKRWQGQGHGFKELDNKRAIEDKLVPSEMVEDSSFHNPWDGPVSIGGPAPLPGPESFTIVFSGVPNADCVQLALQLKNEVKVFAGNWGPEYEPKSEDQVKKNCTTGNMWFLPK